MFRSATAAAVTAIFTLCAGLSLAQAQQIAPLPIFPLFQGTAQEQAACRPDAQRYCRDAQPDQLRVLSCLQRNRSQISRGCRRVLESHGQ
ncbi:MAG: cysteine rich repeat-containing protein [Pseudorhodoplanes sp.]